MAEKLHRRRVVISGRVQGVWFRGSMEREARRLGVAGWVKNRADGRVEAVIEGAPDAVAAILAWCHQGPSGASVERVETREEPAEGLADFEIVY